MSKQNAADVLKKLEDLIGKVQKHKDGEGISHKNVQPTTIKPQYAHNSLAYRLDFNPEGMTWLDEKEYGEHHDYKAAYESDYDEALRIKTDYPGLGELPSFNLEPKEGLRRLLEMCIDSKHKIKAETEQQNGKTGDGKAIGVESNLTEVSILELIKQSESQTLEFKETLEYDTHQNRKNDDVLLSSLKTIAGFLNAKSGTLLIGVDDSGNIKGIERDFSIMKHGNNDRFELKIRNCLKDRFKPQPIGKVNISFEKFTEGTICRVDVHASQEIVHLDDEVYVRDGNTTQLLEGQSLTNWIKQR
jgi:uncharacterized protein YaaQ